jgi:co-chaperonin GroES (HSP10)
VKNGIKKGSIVLVDSAFSERKFSIFPDGTPDGEKDFLCQDKYVFAVFFNQKIIPLGKRILIRRDLEEKIEKGIIVGAEAQPETDQSLSGTVIQFGILPRGTNRNGNPNRWRVNGIAIGDRVMLHRWSEKWTEVSMDGIFYLIVEETDLLYKYE